MRIHVDLVGGGDVFATDDNPDPDSIPVSRYGYRYFMLIADDVTRFRWIYGFKSRQNTYY
jgi:hypothetical protein